MIILDAKVKMTSDDFLFLYANGIFSLTVIIHECKKVQKTLLSQKCILNILTTSCQKGKNVQNYYFFALLIQA